MNYLKSGKKVLQNEIKALQSLEQSLSDEFNAAAEVISNTKGKVIFLGLGKSGHVARKVLLHFQVWEFHPFLFMQAKHFMVISV